MSLRKCSFWYVDVKLIPIISPDILGELKECNSVIDGLLGNNERKRLNSKSQISGTDISFLPVPTRVLNTRPADANFVAGNIFDYERNLLLIRHCYIYTSYLALSSHCLCLVY